MARKTGIVRDDRYLRHGAGFPHPESPARLEALHAMLDTPGMMGQYVPITPRYATPDDIALVHSQAYIDRIARTAGLACESLDADTITTPDTYDTALLAAGGALSAVDAVLNGRTDNAFALVRPPGHHAAANHAAGFCIFNNTAIAARYALARRGLKRILIADWDLHHGDGTQSIFYEDPQVLYFSTHEFLSYPGTGGIDDTGQGPGKGFTINVPLKAGGDNAMFVKAFRGILQPVALAFRPDLIVLSAGFDTHHEDPLGSMRVTPSGFAAMTRILMDTADVCCGGRLVAILEGGYHTGALTESVKAVLMELRDETHFSEDHLERLEYEADQSKDLTLRRIMDFINPQWGVF